MSAAGGEPHPFGWRFTAPLLLASSLNPINSSMLATGLTDIASEFEVTPGAAASLVSVLYLCSAVAQPAVGRLGTVFGQRRVFLVGLAVVMLGGLVGTLAPSFAWLLASRALIGVGTSAAFPTSMALVRVRADRAGIGAPTRVIGLLAIAAQVSLVVGLPLGGLLTSLLGWRSLFAVNVPLALVGFVAVALWIERDRPVERRTTRELYNALDAIGITLFVAATAGLLLFLGDLEHPRLVGARRDRGRLGPAGRVGASRARPVPRRAPARGRARARPNLPAPARRRPRRVHRVLRAQPVDGGCRGPRCRRRSG